MSISYPDLVVNSFLKNIFGVKIMYEIIKFPFLPGANLDKVTISEIVKINDESQEYGLRLSEEDAKELIEVRNDTLKNYGRVEVGAGIIAKIIAKFCDSSYLWQANYTAALNELIETFYYIKNESLDLISDDELIDIMKDFFENSCRGSIELLQGRELEALARNLRYEIIDYRKMEEYSEVFEEEEY